MAHHIGPGGNINYPDAPSLWSRGKMQRAVAVIDHLVSGPLNTRLHSPHCVSSKHLGYK